MGKIKDYYYSNEDVESDNLSLNRIEFLSREGYLEGILVDDGYSFEESDMYSEDLSHNHMFIAS